MHALCSIAKTKIFPLYRVRLASAPFCFLAFCLGVCAPLLQAQLTPWGWIFAAACLLGLLPGKAMWSLSFFLLGWAWASWHFSQQLSSILPSDMERLDSVVQLEIIDLPQHNGKDYKFVARIRQAQTPALATLSGQKIRLSCYRCPASIESGQIWQMTVRLKRPRGYASWGAFDYEKFLFRQQIVAVGYVRNKHPMKLLSASSIGFSYLRERLRAWILKRTEPAHQSDGLAVVLALSLGDKSFLSHKARNALQATVLSHLIAISGLHIALVFAWASLVSHVLLRPFSGLYASVSRQTLVLLPALASAMVYAALAGFAVSTQRALIMLTVFVLAKLSMRQLSLLRVLLYSATLILLFDPFSILDLGFWLSCGAVFIIAMWLQGTSDAKANLAHKARALMQLQLCLWLGMMPLTAVGFGQVSLLSPLMNLVAVPLFSVLLIPASLVSVMLSCLHSDLAWLVTMVVWCLDHCMQWLQQIARWDYASLSVSQPSAISIVGLAALMIITAKLRNIVSVVLCLMALFTVLYVQPWLSIWRSTHQGAQVTLLDVGQGLSMVVQAQGRVLVYDTGPKFPSGFTAAQAVLLPYLAQRGISEVDTLVISHADNDHIGGYQTLANALPIRRLLSSRPDVLPQAEMCQSGQSWTWGGVRFSMLGPEAATPSGSNNGSCVLMVHAGEYSLLITGDIEKQVERHMLAQSVAVAADIMLVPHQGSKTSSTPEFIQAVQPSLALVAAGYKNHYGHPHQEVIERYRQHAVGVISTIDAGSIELQIGKEGMQIRRFRQHHKRFWHY